MEPWQQVSIEERICQGPRTRELPSKSPYVANQIKQLIVFQTLRQCRVSGPKEMHLWALFLLYAPISPLVMHISKYPFDQICKNHSSFERYH